MQTLAAVLIVALLGAPAWGASVVELRTVDGSVSVRGIDDATGGGTFLGIPFAEPPVGDLRFEKATPKTWEDGTVWNATEFAPACTQPKHCNSPAACPSMQAEDCLYLNVFVPRGEAPPEGWPVFVWIHGGSFLVGSGGLQAWSPKGIVSKGIILVTINYRLGALGWLNYGSVEGNQGLSDQREALRWVRDHIAAFGGNPNQVTVGGESAGGMSVLAHLASPLAKGLFDRAIVESGTIALPYNQPTGPNTFYSELMEAVGCPQSKEDYADCLRALPAEAFTEALDQMKDPKELAPILLRQPMDLPEPFYPVIYGQDLPLHPLDAFESGAFNKVPLLIGNNKNEGTVFVDATFSHGGDFAGLGGDGLAEIPALLTMIFNYTVQQEVLQHYPLHLDANETQAGGDRESGTEVLSDICTDYMFTGSSRRVATSFSEAGLPVYTYLFNYTSKSPTPWSPTAEVAAKEGAAIAAEVAHLKEICGNQSCHGAELPFVFDSFLGGKVEADDAAVAKSMGNLWSQFIAMPEPGDLKGEWPQFDLQNQNWLGIGPELKVLTTKGSDKLDFWDTLGYDFWTHKK